MNNKNLLLAFFLSVIPGAGFLYLNRIVRALFYGLTFGGAVFVGVFISMFAYHYEFILFCLFIAAFLWLIHFIDSLIFLSRYQNRQQNDDVPPQKEESERLFITFMSIIPGLGHMQLGLMNRGLTFMTTFFGLLTMVVFVSVLTNQGGFIVFLGLLPIIWIFTLFDVVQQLNRKRAGQTLEDRTVLEEFEDNSKAGQKSKALAMMLAVFPGAGHLYLGLQQRGIQLMAAFLLIIFIIDLLRLSIFLFLIPLIWFYSFFDALQKASRHGEVPVEDKPLVTTFLNYQKWIGIALILVGGYYLLDRVVMGELATVIQTYLDFDVHYIYYNYFQNAVVCLLLIGGGIKLLVGSKKKGELVE